MNTQLLTKILDDARLAAEERGDLSSADAIRCLILETDCLDGDVLEKIESHDRMLADIKALFDACGEEGSDEEAAISDLPTALNEALAEVIGWAV